MAPIIVVIAAGEMGAAIGQRLRLRGASVRTSLNGRSDTTIARAKAAGLVAIEDDAALVADADFVLSVMPPGEAKNLAMRLAPVLTALPRKPVFADCNAVAPETVRGIAAVVAPTGCVFADIGIVGGPPPKEGDASPRLYVSGEGARRALGLKDFGLDLRLVEGGIGEASAVKMGYACMTKGSQAIGAAMMLGAMRNRVAPAVKEALGDSLPELLGYSSRQMPRMFPKAYRWVAEMEEISKFLAADPGASQMLAGAAKLYQQIAKDFEAHAAGGTVATIEGFLKKE
jgi:3-hydroxyisobutyrate dehydrogenase-like beta-hydroxyacid dehydrogenase